ncbi:MAG: hypothetical protein HY294_05730 [Candidatus Rokubacteria bacterium]|nr:hypothetical protein [Candidatus Rokubacteria bacterium]MBI3825473.1 hypothetical protein [Candidatus Rokubacteria bacterium]
MVVAGRARHTYRFGLIVAFILLALSWTAAPAAVLHVPQDFATIQAASCASQLNVVTSWASVTVKSLPRHVAITVEGG